MAFGFVAAVMFVLVGVLAASATPKQKQAKSDGGENTSNLTAVQFLQLFQVYVCN